MDNDTVSAASVHPAMGEERVISSGANTDEPTEPNTSCWMIVVIHIQLQFITYIGGLAQMVERALSMREVGGSILSFSNINIVVKI